MWGTNEELDLGTHVGHGAVSATREGSFSSRDRRGDRGVIL